jgi:hypothetical protein
LRLAENSITVITVTRKPERWRVTRRQKMKLVLVESHGTGFYHELHKSECQDLNKKSEFVMDYAKFDSVQSAKEYYEADNEQYETAYVFEEHCKVFPCVNK